MSEPEVANSLILLLELSLVFLVMVSIVALVEWRQDRKNRYRDRELRRARKRVEAWRATPPPRSWRKGAGSS